MTTFFIDLWHDLREKRLWPVAVGLLAAIVAVPAILFKPASDATPPPTAVPRVGAADTLPVVAVESGPNVGSKLEAFDEKNPFKPMKDLAKEPAASGSSAAGSGSSPSSSAGGSGSAGSGGSAGASSAPATGSDATSGSSGGSASSGATGAPAGGSPSSAPTTTTTHTTTWFHYTADFNFGAPGSPKTYSNVGSFTLLPSEKTPAVVFMGIGGDHKSAMFFISDPAFTADGEGECNAEGDACRFVTLKLDTSSDQEKFTSSDGSVIYDLKLKKISREELGSGNVPDAATPKSATGIGATGAGVATATGTAQSVVPPLFSVGPGVAREEG